MAQQAAQQKTEKRTRGKAILNGFAALFLAAVVGVGAYQLVLHPDTPLPAAWNPTQPLIIRDPVTPLTGWKAARAATDFETCQATLTGFAQLRAMGPLEDSDQCFIADRVMLQTVGGARLAPVETRCAIALRMTLWMEHSVQPAAQQLLGQEVTAVAHMGSYNCRPMRTTNGMSTRMSTHATADAIDIAGFRLSNGTRIDLLQDWNGEGAKSAFLRQVRDGACDWFDLTLSPDYNRLHADHFHLQSRGWGLCR
ncbi:MAG: extensin-like domain-containing protein [Yoonia sp.]